ncbi:hypothetical protein M407DRAFT_28817 [Tulasnella calospora MUT 4182]|uniref:Uncharacterized protein n=1 Tax=Tulasnella calospora MUT 4182 TaxID=1051891 RepID=A0A0C3KJG0_9AGAM|nr:hypothetical protein M407DRAFT_28817 [Tulasnella calospora MUT 4182]
MNPSTATTPTGSAKPAAEREIVPIAPLETDFVFESKEDVAVAEAAAEAEVEAEDLAEDEDAGTEADPVMVVSPSIGCPASLHASTYSKKNELLNATKKKRLEDSEDETFTIKRVH